MPRTVSRRGFVGAALCGCAGLAGGAWGRVSPLSLTSSVTPGYQPVDKDEQGLWQSLERIEQNLAASNLLLQSPTMHAYTVDVMTRLLGSQMNDVRVYLVHDPEFNARMAPTGMMVVNTGLLARVRNEAQYAAVLGHESGHYLLRHSVAKAREIRTKTGVMAFVAAGANIGAGVTAMSGNGYGARSWIDTANAVNRDLLFSIFSFSREQEAQADAFGLKLMEAAGYPPEAASEIWKQVIEEGRASAAARGKRYRDGSRSALSDHPANDQRMLDLADSAREVEAHNTPGRAYGDRRAQWLAAVTPLRSQLLEEQIKLNDPGASLYLLDSLAKDGWDGTLRYWQGEAFRMRGNPGDDMLAANAYAQAIALPNAPPEAWRAQGYALIKAGKAGDGRTALSRYLELAPNATDQAMVRFSLAQ